MPDKTKAPTKKELREDRFVEWVLEAVDYVRSKSQYFTAGAIAVVVGIAGIAYFQKSQEESRAKAAALLGEAMIADDNGQAHEVMRLCEELVGKYSGTPAAAQGTVFLANRYFAQGRYAEAQKLYQSYLADYEALDVLVFAAWNGLAACAEAQGDYQQAAGKYQEYAAGHPGTIQAAMALMEAARCYGLAGDVANQQKTLARVTAEFADSPVAARAREALTML